MLPIVMLTVLLLCNTLLGQSPNTTLTDADYKAFVSRLDDHEARLASLETAVASLPPVVKPAEPTPTPVSAVAAPVAIVVPATRIASTAAIRTVETRPIVNCVNGQCSTQQFRSRSTTTYRNKRFGR